MRSLRARFVVAGVLVCTLLPSHLAGQVQLRGQALRDAVAQHGGKIIVGLKPAGALRGMSTAGVRALSLADQGRITASLVAQGLKVDRQYQLITAISGVMAPERLDALLAHDNVEYVEPDYPRFIDGATTSTVSKAITLAPADSMPYGVSKVRAPEAWAAATPFNDGAGVKVGILDSGGDPAHPDVTFAGGYDGITQSTSPSAWNDNVAACAGHGTHVAGTVGATRGNGIGVVGVAPGVSLYALKFADTGCSLPLVAELGAIDWAVQNGLDVINMSFGSPSPSIAEQQAIQAAEAAGILFVAAAGNNTAPVLYPAAYPEVIAVAATDEFDTRAFFSNIGLELDVAAPGVNILSTLPGGAYGELDGTSQASPHVTGLVALLRASRSTLTQAEAASLLATGAIDLGLKGRDIAFGAGRIDALNSISALLGTTPTVPPVTPLTPGSSVSGLSGTAGSQMFFLLDVPNAAINLSFTLSGGTGDADLYVGYRARPTTGAYHCRSATSGNTESCSFPYGTVGSWFVLVQGSSAFSGVTLTANFSQATQLVLSQQPGGAVAGLPFTGQPLVQLADAQGGPVSRYGVIVTVTLFSGPGALEPVSPLALSATTDVNGVATFTGLGITAVGTHVLQFSSPGLAPVLSSPFAVSLPAALDTLQRGVPKTGLAGVQGSTQLLVLDVPPGATGLSLTLSGGTGVVLMYANQGRYPILGAGNPCLGTSFCVVPAPATGPWYVLLSALSTYSNLTLTATYALPGAQLLFLTQPGTIGAGQPYYFGQTAQLQLADAQGQPIQQGRIPITPMIASGSGVLQEFGGFPDHHQDTDAFGRVDFRFISIDGAGLHTLQFSAPGIPAVVSQPFDVTTPPVTTLQKGVAVPNLSGSFTTANYFSFDVPAGVSTLTFQTSGGTGTYDLKARQGAFPGNLANANCSKVGIAPAQVTCSITNPAPGTWYVLVGDRTVFSGVSLVADYSLSTVAAFSVTQEPGGAVTQVPFPQQPVVQLVDGQGAPVAMAGVAITAAIASGSGQLGGVVLFSLSGKQAPVRAQATTVTTDATGKATFTDLSISGTGTHVLQFTAASLPPSLPPGLSQPFDVAATPPVATLQNQVPVGNLGGPLGSRTYFVLTVPQGTASATFQTTGGSGDADLLVQSGVLPSLASHACLSAGQTSAETCTITNPAAGSWYVMVYGFAPYSGVTVVGGSVAAQLPTQLTITQQPGGAVSGVSFTQQPIVQLADAQGAPVAQAGVLVTATIASGTGTISSLGGVTIDSSAARFRALGVGSPKPDTSSAAPRVQTTSVLTNASGTATFIDLTITGTGVFTVQFSATALTPVTSTAFTVNSTAGIPLSNNVPVANLAGATGSQQLFVLTIPAGQALVTVSTSGGNGDADLYLRYGAPPTLVTFDCRPFRFGNDEACQGVSPPAADLFIMIHGFTAYDGVTLLATYSGPPTQLAMTSQPGGAASGVAFTQQPSVQITDALGIPVFQSGFTVAAAIASGTGQLGGTLLATTTGSGIATFTDLAITGSGQHALQFTSVGLTPVQSSTFVVTGAAATQLLVSQQPGGAVDGVPFTQQPAIQVADAQGQPVAQAGVVITATIQSGTGLLSGTTLATSNAAGVASFTNLAITGSGQHVLQFTASGLTGGQSAPFDVIAPVVTPLQSGVALTNLSGAAGSQSFFVLDVPTATASLVFIAGPATGSLALRVRHGALPTLTTYDCLGSAFGGSRICSIVPAAAGSWYVMLEGTSTYTGGTLVGTFAPTATQLILTQQPSGAATGMAFSQQPVVQLADAQGQPVAQVGVTVTASVSSGSGQLSGTAAVTTDANGTATFTDLVITGTGQHVLTFSASGLTAVQSASFNVTAQAATQLLVTQQPAGAASGVPLTQQPVIQLADAQGATVPQSGVLVTAAIASGPGSLSGTVVAATDPNGTATFSGLTITGPGAYVLEFTTSSLAIQSASFNVATAPATQLAMAVQPGGAVTGIPFTQQPAIQLADAQGQPVSLAGVTVSAALATGTGLLSGTTQATSNASGMAAFTDLTITGTGQHVLQFTALGLTAIQSGTLNVTALPATQLLITLQPGGAVAGVAFTQQPIIQVANAQGQPVAGPGVSITAAIQSGTGALTGTATVTTNAGGAATFANLSLSPAGSYTLSFTAAGLTAATSAAVAVVDPLTISTSSPLAAGTVGTPYTQTLAATGGAAPYAWSVTSGSLPPGLTLASGTGALSGTPTGAGAYTFTAQVSDAGARSTLQGFTLTITGVPAVVVTSMVAALTGGPALSAAETALYNCNASVGFDVGDLLCYLDANPTVSLTAEQLRQIGDLMASDQRDAASLSPTQGKD